MSPYANQGASQRTTALVFNNKSSGTLTRDRSTRSHTNNSVGEPRYQQRLKRPRGSVISQLASEKYAYDIGGI